MHLWRINGSCLADHFWIIDTVESRIWLLTVTDNNLTQLGLTVAPVASIVPDRKQK